MFLGVILTLSLFFVSSSIAEQPMLNVDGFSWAENLVFDSLGGLFVSEIFGQTGGGELHRISYNEETSQYEKKLHLFGFNNVGGLAVSSDGQTVYACVTFKDDTHGIVAASTSESNKGKYTTIAKTLIKGNGLALFNGTFYSAEEGGAKGNGTVFTVDLSTGQETVIYTSINGDGVWIDEKTNRLFVGQMQQMRVAVFDISSSSPPSFLYSYPGPSAKYNNPELQMLDDLTLSVKGGESNEEIRSGDIDSNQKTELLGCDWVGRKLLRFTLDGSKVETVSPPDGITFHELTSVRWGKGKGFDENSVYVTEGGGLSKRTTDRRVVQVRMFEY